MVHGLQGAIWELGGVTATWRSDSLSAATHQPHGGERELTRRYQAVVEHYGVKSTRIKPGKSNENGVVERSNDLLKRRIAQALVRRGIRDFESVAEYEVLVREVVARMNRGSKERWAEERQHLLPLSTAPVPEYPTYCATVRWWTTIHFAKHTYLVPSRLKNKQLEARQYADVIELWYADKLTATMPHIRGEKY